MPTPTASASSISAALKSLLLTATPPSGGSPYFQAVYEAMPEAGFQAQSPVAVIGWEGIAPARLTMGAGRNQDNWTWTIDVYIDKTQTAYDVAYQELLTAVDVLRTAVHAHVQLGITTPSTSVLRAALDGLRTQPDYAHQDGLMYSRLHVRLSVIESYATTIGA